MSGLLDGPPPWEEREPRRWLVVTDAGYRERHEDTLRAACARARDEVILTTWRGDERDKNLQAVAGIVEQAVRARIGRDDGLVGIGGGVTLDVVGFAAGTLHKGVLYKVYPTTLLGSVDAAIAYKRAVNAAGRKNVVGLYYPPAEALIDLSLVRTCPERHIANGLAEVSKVAQVADPELFELLRQYGQDLVKTRFQHHAAAEVAGRAIHSMVEHHRANANERQRRRWPDYGHRIGPHLEMLDAPRLLHGEAVSICCALSAALATGRGELSEESAQEVIDVQTSIGLPVWHEALTDESFLQRVIDDIRAARGGRLDWPVICGEIGNVTYIEPTPQELMRAAARLGEWTASRRQRVLELR